VTVEDPKTWVKPWKGSGIADLPYNAATGSCFYADDASVTIG